MKISKALVVSLFFSTLLTSNADLLVSNFDTPPTNVFGAVLLPHQHRIASSFVIPSDATYQLESVRAISDLGGFTLEVFSDDANSPNVSLEQLSMLSPTTYPDPTTYSSAGLSLLPGERYWIVGWSSEAGFRGLNIAGDNSFTGVEGASIEHYYRSENGGSTWIETDAIPIRMEINAIAIPEPTSIILLGLGTGILFLGRKHHKRKYK